MNLLRNLAEISKSIEEGLESTDVAKIKAARKAAKGLVTKVYNNIPEVPDDEIDENLVQERYQKLCQTHDNFLTLHYRYLFYRDGERDPSYFEKQEKPYRDDVERIFSLAKGSYERDKEALAVSIKNKKKIIGFKEQLALLADAIETSEKKLDGAMIAASTVVKSSDENVRSTAGPIKEELIEAFSRHKSNVSEFKVTTTLLKSYRAEEKFAPGKVFTTKKLKS